MVPNLGNSLQDQDALHHTELHLRRRHHVASLGLLPWQKLFKQTFF